MHSKVNARKPHVPQIIKDNSLEQKTNDTDVALENESKSLEKDNSIADGNNKSRNQIVMIEDNVVKKLEGNNVIKNNDGMDVCDNEEDTRFMQRVTHSRNRALATRGSIKKGRRGRGKRGERG